MSWIPFGSIILKLKDVVVDPKEHFKKVTRAAVDVKDTASDVATNRGATKIAIREVKKKLMRSYEDVKDNYKKLR